MCLAPCVQRALSIYEYRKRVTQFYYYILDIAFLYNTMLRTKHSLYLYEVTFILRGHFVNGNVNKCYILTKVKLTLVSPSGLTLVLN